MLNDFCNWAGGEYGGSLLQELIPLFLLIIAANLILILYFFQYYYWTKTLEYIINMLYLLDFNGILLFFFLKFFSFI